MGKGRQPSPIRKEEGQSGRRVERSRADVVALAFGSMGRRPREGWGEAEFASEAQDGRCWQGREQRRDSASGAALRCHRHTARTSLTSKRFSSTGRFTTRKRSEREDSASTGDGRQAATAPRHAGPSRRRDGWCTTDTNRAPAAEAPTVTPHSPRTSPRRSRTARLHSAGTHWLLCGTESHTRGQHSSNTLPASLAPVAVPRPGTALSAATRERRRQVLRPSHRPRPPEPRSLPCARAPCTCPSRGS